MTYKQAYLSLIRQMNEVGVWVYDTKIHGPGIAFRMFKKTELICIDGKMPWKNRLFVMIHEIGHLFYLNQTGFKKRKNVGTEIQANKVAIKLLKMFKKNNKLLFEYAKLYNSFNRGSKRNSFLLKF